MAVGMPCVFNVSHVLQVSICIYMSPSVSWRDPYRVQGAVSAVNECNICHIRLVRTMARDAVRQLSVSALLGPSPRPPLTLFLEIPLRKALFIIELHVSVKFHETLLPGSQLLTVGNYQGREDERNSQTLKFGQNPSVDEESEKKEESADSFTITVSMRVVFFHS